MAPVATGCFVSTLWPLEWCTLRSILGTGFFTVGLDASISPGLDCLIHEFLALLQGISSIDTPGNGPFK